MDLKQTGEETFVMDIIEEVSSDILAKTMKIVSPEDKVGCVFGLVQIRGSVLDFNSKHRGKCLKNEAYPS